MQLRPKKKVSRPVVAAVNCHVRIVSYVRELRTSTKVPYAEKFERLIRICDKALIRSKALEGRRDTVLVANPEVLGDTYAEMLESLRHIARAGLVLAVLPEDK